MHERGEGADRSLDLAIAYYEKAVQKGSVPAQKPLARLRFTTINN